MKESSYVVHVRAESMGFECNPEMPVVATGFDEAVEKVKDALSVLGVKFCFVHRIDV